MSGNAVIYDFQTDAHFREAQDAKLERRALSPAGASGSGSQDKCAGSSGVKGSKLQAAQLCGGARIHAGGHVISSNRRNRRETC